MSIERNSYNACLRCRYVPIIALIAPGPRHLTVEIYGHDLEDHLRSCATVSVAAAVGHGGGQGARGRRWRRHGGRFSGKPPQLFVFSAASAAVAAPSFTTGSPVGRWHT